MPDRKRNLRFGAAAAVLLLPLLPVAAAQGAANAAPQAPPPAQDCSASSTIEKKLPGGTTWKMCWHNNEYAGLVLEDVTYQPKGEPKPIKVLASGRMAQIHVPYDNGKNEYNDVTEESLGSYPEKLKPADCPGGTIRKIKSADPEVGTVSALCVTTQSRGFAYHGDSGDVYENPAHDDSGQGTDLAVYAIYSAGYYQYVVQWNFSDDGTITPKAGATGNLSPTDYDASDKTGMPLGKGSRDKATSHQHNIFWRLQFQPDGSYGQRIEQFGTKNAGGDPPKMSTSHKTVGTETSGNSSSYRWWRVVSKAGKNADGHPRSWEIVHHNPARYTGRAFTGKDVYFTQDKKCEKYPNQNREFGGRCADTVPKFVNGERLTRPVAWVNVGFHHIPRDEDQTPMPAHWQGFQIAPRDVTAMSPLTPDRLRTPDYNGEPHEH
ncbi:copper amine oxidase [Streptomyces boninensis]|uniref:copper amine oxidase n=1 Tax=Streptomyces boninensis TaxID=2039455 RepID=UPI003B214AE5